MTFVVGEIPVAVDEVEIFDAPLHRWFELQYTTHRVGINIDLLRRIIGHVRHG
jgi:hypothetical protein